MPFGQPYAPFETSNRGDGTTSTSKTSPTTLPLDQLPPLLEFNFVQTQIRSLNLHYPPFLTEQQLQVTEQHAQRQLAHLLGRPYVEVWTEACTTWTEILVRAKGGGEDTVNTAGEQQQEKKRTLHSPPAVPAHTSNTTASMATPTLGQFLTQVNGLIAARNESKLAEWLVLEPPFTDTYTQLIEELRRVFPKHKESALEERCAQSLKAAQEGDQG